MRFGWLAALGIPLVAGCLIPHYEVDPPGTAAGGSVALVGGNGPNGAGGSAGSQAASGSAGTAATAGSGVTECEPSQKRCGTECVEKDDVDYGCTETSCNMSACPADESAALACENGACVVGGCGEGSKKCAGKCVAINDPSYGCGETTCDAQNCPDPQTGTLVCNGTSCEVGICGATTKECESKCVPLDRNNGCADPASCTACDSNQACDGSPSKCACVADNVEACQGVACGTAKNNCGDDAPCTNTCVDTTPACFGNTCVECNAVADCPDAQGNVCAQPTCKSHKCGFATVAAQTACPGNGTCSATLAGVCTRPAVTVGNYTIDATEVTRGAYAAFVAAKAGNVSGQVSQCSWNTSYDPDPFSPLEVASYDLPVGVDWCDAYAYCQWNDQRCNGQVHD